MLLASTAGAIAHGGGYVQPITLDYGPAMQEEAELRCRQGEPADPDDVAKAHTRIETTMQAFFALNAGSRPSDFEDLFDSHMPTWKDANGNVPIEQLGAHMPARPPERTLVTMVVGGDAQTARAIWSTDSGLYYAGDFINHGWLGGWKMWHMTVSAAKPEPPGVYCHFKYAQRY
jgi:hypothetical protein